MYCPRCGRQPGSDELRFCSHCGFKLGVVKASLADEEEGHSTVTTMILNPASQPPRHRNINIGVVLMFVGSMLAILINGRPGGFGREGGGVILAALFGVILLSSAPLVKTIYRLLSWGEQTGERLSASQREMGFGATLMLMGTALAGIVSFLNAGRMNTSLFPVSVLVVFGVLLVISPYLLRALRHLIREEITVPSKAIGGGPSAWSLPAAQEMPIASVESLRVTTSELGVPVGSVTEQTTGLLREK